MADTTEPTIVHTVEVVRYDDPVIITERVAVSAFGIDKRPSPHSLRAVRRDGQRTRPR